MSGRSKRQRRVRSRKKESCSYDFFWRVVSPSDAFLTSLEDRTGSNKITTATNIAAIFDHRVNLLMLLTSTFRMQIFSVLLRERKTKGRELKCTGQRAKFNLKSRLQARPAPSTQSRIQFSLYSCLLVENRSGRISSPRYTELLKDETSANIFR